jgi:hypothetical protein
VSYSGCPDRPARAGRPDTREPDWAHGWQPMIDAVGT